MKQIDIKEYLQLYPGLRKWINECPACHTMGYKPEMPECIGGEYPFSGRIVRKALKPMEIDEAGFCLTCSKFRK